MTPLPLTEREDHRFLAVPVLPAPPPPDDVQQLWFACQVRPWTSLAVIAADAVEAVGALAASLVSVGRLTHTGEIDLLNTQGASLREVSWHLLAISQSAARGGRLVVAADPVISSPVALPLVRAADAVVLVLTLGSSRIDLAKRTLQAVGRERVLGCVLVDAGALA